jgi:hypothetical protein
MRFRQVNFHIKQLTKQCQAIQEPLGIAGVPGQQGNVISIHEFRHSKAADDRPSPMNLQLDELMEQIHE